MHANPSKSHRGLSGLLLAGALMASLLGATPALATETTDDTMEATEQEQVIASVEEALPAEVAETVAEQESASPELADDSSTDQQGEAVVDAGEATSLDEPAADQEPQPTDMAQDAAAADESAPAEPEPTVTTEEQPADTAPATDLEPTAGPALPAGAVAITEGTYILQSGLTANRVVDASGVNPQAGANVATWEYNGGTNQKWIVKRDANSDWYYLYHKSATSGLALGVQGSGAGANAYLASTSTTSDLRRLLWSFVSLGDGGYHLVSAAQTNTSLDIANNDTALAANICLWFSGDATKANQRFYLVNANPQVAAGARGLDGAYTLQLEGVNAPLVADIEGGTAANGGNMIVWEPTYRDNQTIYLEEDKNDPGFYTTWIVGTGKVLDVDHGRPFHDTNILQWEKNGGNNQKWAVSYSTLSNGAYTHVTLTNKATGLVLGTQGTSIWSNVAGRSAGSANTSFRLNAAPLINEGINLITPLTNSNVVIDVDHASTGTADLLLWGNTGTLNQRFELVSAGDNLWRIRTASSGGWVTWQNGMTVVQTGKGADPTTKANTWKAIYKNGGISLINQASNRALDMYGGSTNWGTKIIGWESHGGHGQHFRFLPADLITPGVYYIQSFHNTNSGQARNLDVAGGSTAFGANIQTYAANGGEAQKFAIEKSFGAYTIRNVRSNYFVGTADSSKNHGANVLQAYSAQLWKPEICDGGYIRFVNTNSGMVLESPSGNTANVVQFTKGQAPNSERWKLVGAPSSYKVQGDTAGIQAQKTGKRILMVGNSFTHYNDLQQMVSYLTGAEVNAVTISGAYLGWDNQKNNFFNALNSGSWDYVIIQEQSSYPLVNYSDYVYNLGQYCTAARNAGATPIIYGTWAYRPYGDVNAMSRNLQNAFSGASQSTGTVVANVTKAFADRGHAWDLYADDIKHPSAKGSSVAARIISALIKSLG